MKVIVLGAGLLGVLTAWYLLDEGHEVVVVDRQPGAALETSFANGGQISVGFVEPWAGPGMPWQIAKWLLRDDAPLLFRPRLDIHQWRWGLRFLAACNEATFARNVAQLVALGRYSQAALQQLVARTGIDYQRQQRGILYCFSTQAAFDDAARVAALLREHGVQREMLTREQMLKAEPALASATGYVGATYCASDETGDAQVFTHSLTLRARERGATFLFEHDILGLDVHGGRVTAVRVRERATQAPRDLSADAYVAALGAFTAPLLRPHGIDLPIYPAKGYSATLRLKQPERANTASVDDDQYKIGITRLGERVRIAGTAELAGYDATLHSPTARARCAALVRRYEQLFPGVADASEPNFWAGLRPSTPTNVPIIGQSRIANLWLNAGHGTLGWTLGAGSGRALAHLMSGRQPDVAFAFVGNMAA